MKQLTLLKELRPQLEHGGSLSLGKRKIRRPVVTKRPMHVVLRVGDGGPNLLKFSSPIHEILSRMSHRFGVETYERALCTNHIHLAVRAKTREGFLNFLRAICGRIAVRVKTTKPRKLWEFIPYTRIIEWGQHFRRLLSYVRQNALEAAQMISYQPRHYHGKKKGTPALDHRQGNGFPAGGLSEGPIGRSHLS